LPANSAKAGFGEPLKSQVMEKVPKNKLISSLSISYLDLPIFCEWLINFSDLNGIYLTLQ